MGGGAQGPSPRFTTCTFSLKAFAAQTRQTQIVTIRPLRGIVCTASRSLTRNPNPPSLSLSLSSSSSFPRSLSCCLHVPVVVRHAHNFVPLALHLLRLGQAQVVVSLVGVVEGVAEGEGEGKGRGESEGKGKGKGEAGLSAVFSGEGERGRSEEGEEEEGAGAQTYWWRGGTTRT